MGTIAQKLSYLDETREQLLNSINSVGGSLTEEDTFRSYASAIDEIYDEWPKVEGEGTDVSLEGTRKSGMKIELKGNTYQYSTSGKNLFNPSYAVNHCSVSGNEITLSGETDFYINGGYSYTMPTIFELTPGSYRCITTVSNVYVNIYGIYEGETTIRGVASNTTTPFNATSTLYVKGIRVRSVNGNSLNGTKVKIYLGTGSEYEEYTGGIASPNQDYPQDIQVVSGDNTIKVEGKNLLNISGIDRTSQGITFKTENDYLSISGTSTTGYTSYNIKINTILSGTTIYLYSPDSTGNIVFYARKSDSTNIGSITNGGSLLLTSDMKYLRVNINDTNLHNDRFRIMLSTSPITSYQPYQSSSYPINLGNIELCKIGDYQDKIKKSTGKNLFDKDNGIVSGKFYTDTGEIGTDSGLFLQSSYIEVAPNTQYTFSSANNDYFRMCEYTSNKTFIQRQTANNTSNNITYTTTSNTKYIRVSCNNSNLNTLQLEKGSSSSSYEPYGKVWFLHKEIGKVVFDGSGVSWTKSNSYQGSFYGRKNSVPKGIKYSNLYCNYFSRANIDYASQTSSRYARGTCFIEDVTSSYIQMDFWVDDGTMSTSDFDTWLSTHNTEVYYVLATPTYTEITDTTLLSQLNALGNANSYNNQTNINQDNNDLASILSASALLDVNTYIDHLEAQVEALS